MPNGKTHWARAALAAALMAFCVSAQDAAAQQSPLVGYWECTGQAANGLVLVSTFDYRADGTYVSTQRIVAGPSSIEGGGGGTWRYENGILHDTKQRAQLDRFVRNGVEVPSSDPEWQQLYAQSQSNIGTTASGTIQLNGDVMTAGVLTCNRARR